MKMCEQCERNECQQNSSLCASCQAELQAEALAMAMQEQHDHDQDVTTTAKVLDMESVNRIQSKVADYSHSGYPTFASDDDYLGAPYSEGFYDSCILFWVEDGYDEAEVKETVAEAIEELRRTYRDKIEQEEADRYEYEASVYDINR